MITSTIAIILFIIFSLLSGIHFYWLFGGKWGLEKVIPTKSEQAITLSIPKFATLIVALVLLLFGVIYLIKSRLINLQILNSINEREETISEALKGAEEAEKRIAPKDKNIDRMQ